MRYLIKLIQIGIFLFMDFIILGQKLYQNMFLPNKHMKRKVYNIFSIILGEFFKDLKNFLNIFSFYNELLIF